MFFGYIKIISITYLGPTPTHFIQDLTASRFGGYLVASAICAGGTPETNRVEVQRNYDLLEKINNIKAMCNITT